MSFGLIVAAAALASVAPASLAGADTAAPANTSANEPVAGTQSPDVKPNRLRFRSASGTCACTCAKGGMSEAEIRKAEEARIGTKD
jgi:hypothetical protein